jgi:hypothetical protein
MSGQPFRSAWSDPDHVRLAQFRSWWDAGASDRGPLPAGEDPWQAESLAAKAASILGISLDEVRQQVSPGSSDGSPQSGGEPVVTGPKGYPRHDDYAAWRCLCGHIFYLSDQLGAQCRFCACPDHRPPQRGETA